MPRYSASANSTHTSVTDAAGSPTANAARLLSNTNLFTLSVSNRHYANLSAALFCGYSDNEIGHGSRYGHRAEIELRPRLCRAFREDKKDRGEQGDAYNENAETEAVSAAARPTPLVTFSSDSKCFGQGFVASLLTKNEKEPRGKSTEDCDMGGATTSPSSSCIFPPLDAVNCDTACTLSFSLSESLGTSCPSTEATVAKEAALISMCPLIRHIEGFGELMDSEVSSVRSFYGLGPNGAQKRPRVASDADRLHSATVVGSGTLLPHPFVISKRALINEFTVHGGPSAAMGAGAASASSAVAGANNGGLLSPTSPSASASSTNAFGTAAAAALNRGGKSIPQATSQSSSPAGLGAATSAGVLPAIKPSAPFAAPPLTPAAATAAAAAAASATATTPNQQLACEVSKTLPVTCPDSVSVAAVQKIALDLVQYGAACAVSRRQPYAGRAYVVGVEDGLDALIPPTAGAISGGSIAEGALGTTSGGSALSGRARKRGAATFSV